MPFYQSFQPFRFTHLFLTLHLAPLIQEFLPFFSAFFHLRLRTPSSSSISRVFMHSVEVFSFSFFSLNLKATAHHHQSEPHHFLTHVRKEASLHSSKKPNNSSKELSYKKSRTAHHFFRTKRNIFLFKSRSTPHYRCEPSAFFLFFFYSKNSLYKTLHLFY